MDRVRYRALTVIGAATSAGAYGPGQERAPEYLRAHGLVNALGVRADWSATPGTSPHSYTGLTPEHPQAANVEQVREAVLSVAAAVSDAYTRGEDVLVLGGDCTIELGTVAGALADGSSVGLIYIDLDGDPNTPATGDGIFDWMGLAHPPCPRKPQMKPAAWRYASAMKKPLRCWLTFHEWRVIVNDEGQRYKTCARCGAYRDFDPRPGIA